MLGVVVMNRMLFPWTFPHWSKSACTRMEVRTCKLRALYTLVLAKSD